MKLSKNQIIQLIFSEYQNTPTFKLLLKTFNRMPEFEFIRIAEDCFHQKIQIARKNTYLIG